MIKKIIGIIMAVATIAVIVFTAIRSREYTSLLNTHATVETKKDSLTIITHDTLPAIEAADSTATPI